MCLHSRWVVLAVALVGLSGCAVKSDLMAPAPDQATQPAPDEARIVFMRPSRYGGAIQASVFETTNDQTQFLGIVSARTKMAVDIEQGRHVFMVVSEAADFMRADVLAGKTYYAIVEPRMGVWKARFSLVPVQRDPNAEFQLGSEHFERWRAELEPVEVTPAARQWARDNMVDIKRKRREYWEDWQAKPPSDKAKVTLERADGS